MSDLWVPDTAKRAIPLRDGRPAWDRQPTVGYEEVAHGRTLSDDGHRPYEMICEGPYALIDRDRFLRGEICLKCQHCLPECPSTPGAYKRILDAPGFDITRRYEPWPGERLAKERLALGNCPLCASEMSPEFAAAMFAGEWDTKEGSSAREKWARDG